MRKKGWKEKRGLELGLEGGDREGGKTVYRHGQPFHPTLVQLALANSLKGLMLQIMCSRVQLFTLFVRSKSTMTTIAGTRWFLLGLSTWGG